MLCNLRWLSRGVHLRKLITRHSSPLILNGHEWIYLGTFIAASDSVVMLLNSSATEQSFASGYEPRMLWEAWLSRVVAFLVDSHGTEWPCVKVKNLDLRHLSNHLVQGCIGRAFGCLGTFPL
ncbi:hypothetical protein VFPPC_16580 [Pochonia chlamydosporia 170]|uniref:Uncharacterized protein n=1 Tax=Pochonia chlamydosporia 170 TaxID=1380566 RepID=A0A179F8W0_METCM|nr:hypothetical protein VFPPC_16580 [Pochonia chlamydosporia 170]OAQ61935.1 hypothetical protein VFPPC_16580 [Pochonia chlamydosporia 170]